METNERILLLIKEKGPVLPVHISKEIKENILMTSARLSELISSNKLKISSIKVGGSPLYYLQGQEPKLQDFSGNLPGAEKKAYELLKQSKIIRESTAEPVIRVALRQLKDFAVPLQVTHENNTEVFWRWFLMDNKEAEPLIKHILLIKEKEEKKETINTTKSNLGQKEPTGLSEITMAKEKITSQVRKDPVKKPKMDRNLPNEISNFFSKNSISIIESKEVKKNSEMEFLIELKTQIGHIRYFCKAKNKRSISEGDINSALLQAQSRNLPLLFLTTGIIAKKVKDLIDSNFKNVICKEI